MSAEQPTRFMIATVNAQLLDGGQLAAVYASMGFTLGHAKDARFPHVVVFTPVPIERLLHAAKTWKTQYAIKSLVRAPFRFMRSLWTRR